MFSLFSGRGFFTKWTVPKADAELFDQYEPCIGMFQVYRCLIFVFFLASNHSAMGKMSKDDWVAASSCDGLLFLWPVPENLPENRTQNRTPPVVRPSVPGGRIGSSLRNAWVSPPRGDWCW